MDTGQTLKRIRVGLSDGSAVECELHFSRVPPWRITFSGLPLARTEFVAGDLFEALKDLRLELERIGGLALCAGARRDVFPSGMSRSMGGGRIACVMTLGRQSRETDQIDIFDSASPQTVGTVEEQRVFHNQWVESLKHGR